MARPDRSRNHCGLIGVDLVLAQEELRYWEWGAGLWVCGKNSEERCSGKKAEVSQGRRFIPRFTIDIPGALTLGHFALTGHRFQGQSFVTYILSSSVG